MCRSRGCGSDARRRVEDLGTPGLLRRCLTIEGVVLSNKALEYADTVKLNQLMDEQEAVQQPPIVDAFAETRQLDEALVEEVNASIDAAPMSSYEAQFTTGSLNRGSRPNQKMYRVMAVMKLLPLSLRRASQPILA